MDMKVEQRRAHERKREVEKTVADVREIERLEGVTRASLEKIKQRLGLLAARKDLFTASDFPPPEPGSKRNSCLYRVAEDPDHRFALYVNSSDGSYGTPAHPREKGSAVVRQGAGVAFMPEDLHSIHQREYYKADERTWKVFPPHCDIREARR